MCTRSNGAAVRRTYTHARVARRTRGDGKFCGTQHHIRKNACSNLGSSVASGAPSCIKIEERLRDDSKRLPGAEGIQTPARRRGQKSRFRRSFSTQPVLRGAPWPTLHRARGWQNPELDAEAQDGCPRTPNSPLPLSGWCWVLVVCSEQIVSCGVPGRLEGE